MLTVGDIKSFIGANAGDVSGFDDTYFEDLEADVVAFLESTVLRRWLTETAERVEVVDGPPNASQTIAVRGFIRDITTVEYRYSTDADWTELVAVTDYEFDVGGETIHRRGACWPCGPRTVRVTYDSGYSLAVAAGDTYGTPPAVATADVPSDAPRDLQRLVRLMCAVWHRTRPVQRPGGEGPIDLLDVPMSARMTIERYSASRLP